MITKDTTGLKFLVKEYSNKGKLIWWEPKSKLFDPKTLDDFKTNYNFGIDVRKKRQDLIAKMAIIEKDYNPPGINYKRSYTKYYLIAVVLIVIIIALS